MGFKEALCDAYRRIGSENKEIVLVTSDVGKSVNSAEFRDVFGERFINVGIAEQNMIGVAAGLTDSGYRVFATTFSNFATLRANEFVRHFMGYMQSPVKLVGVAAGFSTGFSGYTHYGIEDVAALRAISNLTVVSPADGLETKKTIEALINYDAPVYLRLTGTPQMPVIFKNDYDFQIGKAIELQNGLDVTIIACGSMVSNALEAAKLLDSEGISCSVINMHTIKPLDTNAINMQLSKKLIVSVEEHSTIGGLGSAIAEYISELNNTPVLLRLGVKQGYIKAGGYNYMLEQNGLLAIQIAGDIKGKLKEISR